MLMMKDPQERKTTIEWDDGKIGNNNNNKLILTEIFPSVHERLTACSDVAE